MHQALNYLLESNSLKACFVTYNGQILTTKHTLLRSSGRSVWITHYLQCSWGGRYTYSYSILIHRSLFHQTLSIHCPWKHSPTFSTPRRSFFLFPRELPVESQDHEQNLWRTRKTALLSRLRVSSYLILCYSSPFPKNFLSQTLFFSLVPPSLSALWVTRSLRKQWGNLTPLPKAQRGERAPIAQPDVRLHTLHTGRN